MKGLQLPSFSYGQEIYSSQWRSQIGKLLVAITVALVGFIVNPQISRAKPINLVDKQQGLLPILEYNPPNHGGPGTSRGGGSRPGCPETDKPLTALNPATNYGETVDGYPTFWLYIPYESGVVELRLEEESTLGEQNSNKKVYQPILFQVSQGPGVMKFPLPRTADPLKINSKYRWRFFLLCGSDSGLDTLSVDGVVKRVEPTAKLTSELDVAETTRGEIIAYAANGLWYEALTKLAELRRGNEEDGQVAIDWEALLGHPIVRLGEIVPEKVVNCCFLDGEVQSSSGDGEDK